MSIKFFWQLPTAADARPTHATRRKRGERDHGAGKPFAESITDPRGNRFNYFDYLAQIATGADFTHFDGIFVEHDVTGDESWIVAGTLARATRCVRVITEFEASRGSAVYAAKNAMSFQRYSANRFDWAVASGGSLVERKRQGDQLPDSEVHARISEFLTVARGVVREVPFTFKGDYFEVLNGGFQGPLSGNPMPTVYLSGDSDADIALSARQADVYIASLNDVDALGRRLKNLREQSSGRALAIALRLDLIAAETDAEALEYAERYWAQTGQVGAVPHGAAIPALYSGANFNPRGANSVLVGSPASINAAIKYFVGVGVEQFILRAPASLEAVYYVGEQILPGVRRSVSSQNPTAVAVAVE